MSTRKETLYNTVVILNEGGISPETGITLLSPSKRAMGDAPAEGGLYSFSFEPVNGEAPQEIVDRVKGFLVRKGVYRAEEIDDAVSIGANAREGKRQIMAFNQEKRTHEVIEEKPYKVFEGEIQFRKEPNLTSLREEIKADDKGSPGYEIPKGPPTLSMALPLGKFGTKDKIPDEKLLAAFRQIEATVQQELLKAGVYTADQLEGKERPYELKFETPRQYDPLMNASGSRMVQDKQAFLGLSLALKGADAGKAAAALTKIGQALHEHEMFRNYTLLAETGRGKSLKVNEGR